MFNVCVDAEVRFCERDGVRLAYTMVGAGPPVLWVAGWVGHVELAWLNPKIRGFQRALARHHTLVVYDKHGTGLSDRNRVEFTLDSELADLRAVADHLRLGRFALVGHSEGAPVAIAYAAARPEHVSHLVLHGGWARGADVSPPEVRASLVSVVRAHWGLGSEVLADLLLPGAEPQAREWFARLERRSAAAETAARLLELAHAVDVTDRLPHVRVPTLVLHRKGDRAAPAALGREVAAAIPDAQFRLLEGSTHLPWEGDADSVVRAITEFLGDAVGGVSLEEPSVLPTPAPGHQAIFRREGEYWTLRFDDRLIRLRDSKGLRAIAQLLTRPGVEIHALDLLRIVEGPHLPRIDARSANQEGLTRMPTPGGELGPALDPQAVSSYERRLGELRDDLEEAEAMNDPGRAARSREEIEAIAGELAGAFGLGGRARRTGSAAERARVNVTRVIKNAIRRIRREDPVLGHLLDSTIRTGAFCAYLPPPEDAPDWIL